MSYAEYLPNMTSISRHILDRNWLCIQLFFDLHNKTNPYVLTIDKPKKRIEVYSHLQKQNRFLLRQIFLFNDLNLVSTHNLISLIIWATEKSESHGGTRYDSTVAKYPINSMLF